MPEEGVELTPSTKLLTSDEILRLVSILAEDHNECLCRLVDVHIVDSGNYLQDC